MGRPRKLEISDAEIGALFVAKSEITMAEILSHFKLKPEMMNSVRGYLQGNKALKQVGGRGLEASWAKALEDMSNTRAPDIRIFAGAIDGLEFSEKGRAIGARTPLGEFELAREAVYLMVTLDRNPLTESILWFYNQAVLNLTGELVVMPKTINAAEEIPETFLTHFNAEWKAAMQSLTTSDDNVKEKTIEDFTDGQLLLEMATRLSKKTGDTSSLAAVAGAVTVPLTKTRPTFKPLRVAVLGVTPSQATEVGRHPKVVTLVRDKIVDFRFVPLGAKSFKEDLHLSNEDVIVVNKGVAQIHRTFMTQIRAQAKARPGCVIEVKRPYDVAAQVVEHGGNYRRKIGA